MNKIVKTLIISDFLIWSGWGLFTPIFAVFVTKQISGGTLAVVGIAEFIFLGTKSLTQIIFGDYLDTDIDDKRTLRWVVISSLIFSLGAALYLFCHLAWQLYVVEFLQGLSAAMNYPAWYSLFVRHLDPRRRAFSISFHSTAVEGGTAIAAAIGGLTANYFGFPFVVQLLVLFSLMGTTILLLVWRPLSSIEQKERAESRFDSLPILPSQTTELQLEILPVRKYGDPVLRFKAKAIKEIDDKIRILTQQMLTTMYRNGGCGLAAPQVGQSINLIVLDVGEGPMTLINTKILKKSHRKTVAEEGCLSLPSLNIRVKRSRKIEIEYFQISDGKRVKLTAEGLLARAILHELEHIEGILITDKLTFWPRWKLRHQIAEIKNNAQQFLKEQQREKFLASRKISKTGKTQERKIETAKTETRALMKVEPPEQNKKS